MSIQIVKIEGMSCQHCVRHVSEALASLPGVTEVEVDLEGGSASVDVAADWDEDAARKVLLEAGYTLTASRPG